MLRNQLAGVVEYWAESFKAMLIAQELRVISVAFCGNELRDPTARQRGADEAETAESCVRGARNGLP